ncbi:hypothetical protein G6F59_016399 [Rhizopus arrhizus]|nr:hypothetical protein G6F59_016399 [Rhizopus arrhizus]
MGAVRSGDHCLRPGRGDWHGDRAETAVRPATAVGRSDHRAGYAAGAVADEPRLPCTGSLRDRAADGDLRLLRGADRNGRATGDGGTRRRHPACAGGDRSACAVHRHRHHRRHGDATQPVPAFVHRADPRLPAHR